MRNKTRALRVAAKLADALIATAAGLCVTLTLYYVYVYGWTGAREFAHPIGVAFYYVLPVLVASLLLASLKLDALQRIKLTLMLGSVAVPLYAIEAWLSLPSQRLRQRLETKIETAKKFGVDFDVRSKGQVLADLRDKGIDAYPAIVPHLLLEPTPEGYFASVIKIGEEEVLPLTGISNKVSVLCNETGIPVSYESDERGFQNPKGLWAADRIDLVALGDSYVNGWCVSPHESFVTSIRRDFPRTLNLGVTGHGPLMMLGTLKEYASRVKPRVVLWFYFDGNDLGGLKKERQSPLLMRYLDKDFLQRLYNRQPEIESALAHYLLGEMNRLRRSNFVEESAPPKNRIQELEGFIKLAETRTRLGLTGVLSGSNDVDQENEFEEVKRLLTRVLAEAKRTVDTWNGEIYFVYLTGFSGWERDAEKEQVLKVARNLGFPIIDLHEAFDEHGDPFSLFPFRQPAHYNESGHQYVAQVVLKSLELDANRNPPVSDG